MTGTYTATQADPPTEKKLEEIRDLHLHYPEPPSDESELKDPLVIQGKEFSISMFGWVNTDDLFAFVTFFHANGEEDVDTDDRIDREEQAKKGETGLIYRDRSLAGSWLWLDHEFPSNEQIFRIRYEDRKGSLHNQIVQVPSGLWADGLTRYFLDVETAKP